MTERIHGKPIDIAKFKQPVLSDIRGHLEKIERIVHYLSEKETAIEQKSCYICGNNAREHLVDIHGFSYVTCDDCGHVYTTRRYTDDAIRRFYEDNAYWAKVTYANKETCQYRRENVARPKVEFAERYLSNTRGVWLDIGSGIGDIVSVAKERGWQAVGLELSATSVEFALEVFGVELQRQTLEEYLDSNPGIIGELSVVSMIGLLEHIVDPMAMLRRVRSALRAGGGVMIQVPNAYSLTTMIQETSPENVFRHMSPIEHIMLFTESSLTRALELAGFEIVAHWYHGLDVYELMVNQILNNSRISSSRLYRALIEAMNDLQMVIDKRELSDRIICVARVC